MLDELDTHEEDEPKHTEEDDAGDTKGDDGKTPEEKEEADKAKKAAEAKAAQKKAWKEAIKTGKKKLEDMPENLGWLKKEIETEEKEPEKKPKPKKDDVNTAVQEALKEERATESLDALIKSLDEAGINEEMDAQLREEYEDQLSDFSEPTTSQKYRCLVRACRLVGLKDAITAAADRRRKGMVLPPFGGRKRDVVDKDKTTEMEKRLGGNLPPGYKA